MKKQKEQSSLLEMAFLGKLSMGNNGKGGFKRDKENTTNFLRNAIHGIISLHYMRLRVPGQASTASTSSATSAARNDGFFGRLICSATSLWISLSKLRSRSYSSHLSLLTLDTVD